MNRLRVLTTLAALWLSAAPGCSGPQPIESPITTPFVSPHSSPLAPPDAPASSANMASISGVLYSTGMADVIRKTAFYLIPARDGGFPPILNPSAQAENILGISDENGQFAVKDIPPGKYYLVVWAPYDWVPAQISGQDPTSLLLQLQPDQRLPLGVVAVPWP